MKTLFYTAFAAIFGVATQSASALPYTMLYDAHACVLGVTCHVAGHGTASGPGPTNQDFFDFFSQYIFVSPADGNFSWETKSNKRGDWFGLVDGPDGIHTSYVWHGGKVLCCLLDEPYTITDGNDHGLFIGEDIYGTSNSGQPFYPTFLAVQWGPYALAPVSYALTAHAWSVTGGWADFVSIDDKDRILAIGGPTGWLEFDPVPEPATALILAPLLAFAFRRRRA